MKKKETTKYIKQAILGIAVILVYFIFSNIDSYLYKLFDVNINRIPLFAKIICSLASSFITLATITLILHKKVEKDIIDIKKNHKKYYSKYFKYWLIGLAIMMISNLLILLITKNELPANEEAIRNLMDISPIYIYISAVLIAPLTEELVFRQGIRNIITNDKIFILVSGLVFGSLHVITGFSGMTDLLYLIPYCTPGFIFAYILTKTDNVLVSSGLHLMHNGLLIALQFFVLIFG